MIDRIKKYNLCVGCGLCESVLGKEICKMKLGADGFYTPVINQLLSKAEAELIGQLCPGIHVETRRHNGEWGELLSVCQAWSSDDGIRHKAASGGVVTSLAVYLIEHHRVDAVLQVGVRNGSYIYNEIQISRTRADVVEKAQSRYAPALTLHNIMQILNENADTYAFIGKPCDVAAIRNILRIYPKYKSRFKYCISIFCAGMPSYNATIKTWQQSGHIDEPVSLKYRGDGWPGKFKAVFKDGSDYQLSYNESWGNILGKHLCFRCKVCPDGIGMLADIAVGDSWNTKNGYPDFTEAKGRCFCMIRNEKGESLIRDAYASGYIVMKDLCLDEIKSQQPYQYQRRKLEGWRLLPVILATKGLIRFKGLCIWRQAVKVDAKTGLSNLFGTYNRLKQMNGK